MFSLHNHFWALSDVCDWAELDLNQDLYLAILNSSLFGGSILGLKALVVFMSSTNQKSLLKLFWEKKISRPINFFVKIWTTVHLSSNFPFSSSCSRFLLSLYLNTTRENTDFLCLKKEEKKSYYSANSAFFLTMTHYLFLVSFVSITRVM